MRNRPTWLRVGPAPRPPRNQLLPPFKFQPSAETNTPFPHLASPLLFLLVLLPEHAYRKFPNPTDPTPRRARDAPRRRPLGTPRRRPAPAPAPRCRTAGSVARRPPAPRCASAARARASSSPRRGPSCSVARPGDLPGHPAPPPPRRGGAACIPPPRAHVRAGALRGDMRRHGPGYRRDSRRRDAIREARQPVYAPALSPTNILTASLPLVDSRGRKLGYVSGVSIRGLRERIVRGEGALHISAPELAAQVGARAVLLGGGLRLIARSIIPMDLQALEDEAAGAEDPRAEGQRHGEVRRAGNQQDHVIAARGRGIPMELRVLSAEDAQHGGEVRDDSPRLRVGDREDGRVEVRDGNYFENRQIAARGRGIPAEDARHAGDDYGDREALHLQVQVRPLPVRNGNREDGRGEVNRAEGAQGENGRGDGGHAEDGRVEDHDANDRAEDPELMRRRQEEVAKAEEATKIQERLQELYMMMSSKHDQVQAIVQRMERISADAKRAGDWTTVAEDLAPLEKARLRIIKSFGYQREEAATLRQRQRQLSLPVLEPPHRVTNSPDQYVPKK
ncbi:unnamed protein product [Urochloa humidicola]